MSIRINFNSSISLTCDSNLADDYQAEGFFLPICGSIIDDSDDQELEIGQVEATYVDLYRLQSQKVDMLHMADAESGELEELISTFYESGYYNLKEEILASVPDFLGSENILCIDKVKIDEKRRGKGIGLAAIQRTIDLFGRECGLIVLKPFPLQFAGRIEEFAPAVVKADTAKLKKYYRKGGFRTVKGCEYMVLNPALKAMNVLLTSEF